MLNRHKLMGAIGITLTLLALWAGGASVQVGPRYAAPGYIGLDWFILDLMLSAMLFIFLEKMWPHMREQAILRPDWWHDSRYFLLNHLLIGIYAFAATMFAPTFFSWAINRDIQQTVSSLPWAVQFVMAIVLAGLVGTRSTAPCTKSNSSGISTPCITRSSTWTGWPVSRLHFLDRWSRARWCWFQRILGSPRNR